MRVLVLRACLWIMGHYFQYVDIMSKDKDKVDAVLFTSSEELVNRFAEIEVER